MLREIFLADPIPESSETDWGNRFRTLKTKSSVRLTVLFRVLLSKLLYTEEEFTEEDEVMLFLSWEETIRLCSREEEFNRKNIWLVFLTRNYFMNLSAFVQDRESQITARKELEPLFSFGRSSLNAYIYYGFKGQYKVEMKIGKPKKPKDRNRIGVGYRDKGNARNTAWDASPPWQEVAIDEWFQTHTSHSNWKTKEEQIYIDLKSCGLYPWQYPGVKTRNSRLCKSMRG